MKFKLRQYAQRWYYKVHSSYRLLLSLLLRPPDSMVLWGSSLQSSTSLASIYFCRSSNSLTVLGGVFAHTRLSGVDVPMHTALLGAFLPEAA